MPKNASGVWKSEKSFQANTECLNHLIPDRWKMDVRRLTPNVSTGDQPTRTLLLCHPSNAWGNIPVNYLLLVHIAPQAFLIQIKQTQINTLQLLPSMKDISCLFGEICSKTMKGEEKGVRLPRPLSFPVPLSSSLLFRSNTSSWSCIYSSVLLFSTLPHIFIWLCGHLMFSPFQPLHVPYSLTSSLFPLLLFPQVYFRCNYNLRCLWTARTMVWRVLVKNLVMPDIKTMLLRRRLKHIAILPIFNPVIFVISSLSW